MTEKSIFITGAASGIGRATALWFAEKGWYVGLYDINESALAELSSRIGQDRTCYQQMDVSSPEAVKAGIDHFASHTSGKMNAMFNCAGLLRMGQFKDIPLEEQIKTVNVNFTGIISCIHAAYDLLKQTHGAAYIVNMCSASATYGSPELATYSATKFAVKGLTEALNIEFENDNIIVCDIMVPYVDTPMLKQEKTASSIANLGIHLKPEQIAGLVWQAVHGNKVHWTKGMGLINMLNLMPSFVKRASVKRLLQEK